MDSDGLLDLNQKTFDDRNLRRGNAEAKKRMNKKEERERFDKMRTREDQRNGVLTQKQRKLAEKQLEELEQLRVQKLQKAKDESKQDLPNYGIPLDEEAKESATPTIQTRSNTRSEAVKPNPQYLTFLRSQLNS
jgi:dsDNA-binding SOS-regulon protein